MKTEWHPIVTPTRIAIPCERLDGTVIFNRQNVIAFQIVDDKDIVYMDNNGFAYSSSHPRQFGFAEVLINGVWTL